MEKRNRSVNRRDFLKTGAAVGAGATALTAQDLHPGKIRFDHTADVVVIGAGAAGLPAAISARDHGASVLVLDENHDIGGHAMLSGGRIPLGGGHSLQKKYGIDDSADRVYLDHTNHRNPEFRFADRDLVRAWADENAASFEFLLANGVVFEEAAPTLVNGGTVPRLFVTHRYSDNLKETINGRPGSGLVRHLEASARAKGVNFLLHYKLTGILREGRGRVVGVAARTQEGNVHIRARKGVILATGGHTSNVAFRRMFDPRLTEEYQVTGEPWTKQNADGEILAMSIGAALWATSNQSNEGGRAVTKTAHIGCRYGYQNLKWEAQSPIFSQAGASGLTVRSFEDVILVNQVGRRFWNELDDSHAFLDACLGTNGNLGKAGKANGGGPIWAIFDSAAVQREGWDPKPPNVDPNGWFFSAETISDLAGRIENPYQRAPISASALQETLDRFNSYVDMRKDPEFQRTKLQYKIQTPPFYAAWSTPILHDTLTGLKITPKCQVVDVAGQFIPGLYCAGETAGGFGLHGLPRAIVFGRIAGREAAMLQS